MSLPSKLDKLSLLRLYARITSMIVSLRIAGQIITRMGLKYDKLRNYSIILSIKQNHQTRFGTLEYCGLMELEIFQPIYINMHRQEHPWKL